MYNTQFGKEKPLLLANILNYSYDGFDFVLNNVCYFCLNFKSIL